MQVSEEWQQAIKLAARLEDKWVLCLTRNGKASVNGRPEGNKVIQLRNTVADLGALGKGLVIAGLAGVEDMGNVIIFTYPRNTLETLGHPTEDDYEFPEDPSGPRRLVLFESHPDFEAWRQALHQLAEQVAAEEGIQDLAGCPYIGYPSIVIDERVAHNDFTGNRAWYALNPAYEYNLRLWMRVQKAEKGKARYPATMLKQQVAAAIVRGWHLWVPMAEEHRERALQRIKVHAVYQAARFSPGEPERAYLVVIEAANNLRRRQR